MTAAAAAAAEPVDTQNIQANTSCLYHGWEMGGGGGVVVKEAAAMCASWGKCCDDLSKVARLAAVEDERGQEYCCRVMVLPRTAPARMKVCCAQQLCACGWLHISKTACKAGHAMTGSASHRDCNATLLLQLVTNKT